VGGAFVRRRRFAYTAWMALAERGVIPSLSNEIKGAGARKVEKR